MQLQWVPPGQMCASEVQQMEGYRYRSTQASTETREHSQPSAAPQLPSSNVNFLLWSQKGPPAHEGTTRVKILPPHQGSALSEKDVGTYFEVCNK